MNTQFYGFFCRSSDPELAAGLRNHGARIAPEQHAIHDDQGQHTLGLRAPCVASQHGISVALLGEPYLAGQPLAATAAAVDAIIDAYRRQGEGFLASLTGRFTLALIDQPADCVILAVDPMGLGRLAYSVTPEGVFFADSVEALANRPGAVARINPQALYDYLLLHMVPAPGSIFQGVSKLLPGTFACFKAGQLQTRNYWLPEFATTTRQTETQLKAELRTALRAAVASHAPDTHTGAFLSGGLDSSSVVGMLSEVSASQPKTFSIGFGYPDYDELPYARIANRRFGCQGHEHVVTGEEIATAFPLIAQAYDEPFGNSSALPTYYCAMLAKANGVDHLLAGDGGDELFAGNSRYAEHEIFAHYQKIPAALRQHLLEPLLARWPATLADWPIRKARGYIDKANTTLPARLETWNFLHRLGAANVLHPDFLATVDVRAPFNDMQQVWDATPARSQLSHMLYYDWHYTLAYNDLRKVETMSRLAGVRVSYPMLHPAVIELSTRIPPNVMMPGAKLRHFYKQAMQGFLPDEIIHKKKHGFGLPFGLWLQESPQLREMIFGNLASLRQRHLIRPEFLEQLLKLHGQDDARYYGVFIWVLAMLEQWFQQHRVSPT